VESPAQLEQLAQLGCERVQGYLLCHPMPATQAGEFLQPRLQSFDLDTIVARRQTSLAGV
jgi:EAL domain-containing protein (putative c-di-GMP-specific phosphodiesterase class I)